MGTKVEFHQLIDLSVDIHEGRSTVNFGYLNRILHELVNHLGIANLEILIDESDNVPPPKQTVSIPNTTSGPIEVVSQRSYSPSPTIGTVLSEVENRTVLSDADNRTISDLKEKVDDLEKKLSIMDDLVPEETKVSHTESLVGDMWNFVNLGKRVDSCEQALEAHAKMLDELRKGMKDLNSYKFYWDQLKDNSTMDLRTMIDGLISDMGEKTKEINKLKEKIKTLENSKPDEALAQELAKKVEALSSLKDEIDGKLATLPTMDHIRNIEESFVTWIGLDEILRNYKPPRTPVPPSREGIEALHKADELGQKTDDLGNKITGLQKEVSTKVDADAVDARISEAIKQKRPPSSRSEAARLRFTDTLQEFQDRILKLEDRPSPVFLPHHTTSVHTIEIHTSPTVIPPIPAKISSSSKSSSEASQHDFIQSTVTNLRNSIENLDEEFGGKSLPDDLKIQLEALQKGLKDALTAAELIGQISQENETNKSAISELNGQIEDMMDRYKILQDAVDSVPKQTSDVDSTAVQQLKDTMKALKEEQEAHHDEINKLNQDCAQKDLHLKTLYSGVDDLRELKADKEFVVMEMEDKADKRTVDHKANRIFVDDHFEKLNSGLQAALQRCQGQEDALKNAITQISSDVDGKLDRMELQSVKDFLENRLNKLKTGGPPAPPPQQEDPDPAGMRRRLLKFHCISCDRPVEVNSGGMLPSTLPVAYGFPGMRSNRPYTTYELELIRQHQRNLLHIKNSDPYDLPPTSRSCGGQHTMTYSHRRTRISALSQFFKEDEVTPIPVPLRETEIQGQDGHIYRGRLQQKFPVLPRVGHSIGYDEEKLLQRAYARRSSENRPRTAPRTRQRQTLGY